MIKFVFLNFPYLKRKKYVIYNFYKKIIVVFDTNYVLKREAHFSVRELKPETANDYQPIIYILIYFLLMYSQQLQTINVNT